MYQWRIVEIDISLSDAGTALSSRETESLRDPALWSFEPEALACTQH